jgi:CHAD domain-containing protein
MGSEIPTEFLRIFKKSRMKTGKKLRFYLRINKPIGKEIKSLAKSQLESALQALHGNKVSPKAVHMARTSIKKIRVIIQLTSPALDNHERKKIQELLHEASFRLGPLRDAEVQVQTLDLILDSRNLNRDDYYTLREGFSDVAKQRNKNGIRLIPSVVKSLERSLRGIDSWNLDALGGSEIRRRLRRIYRRGRTSLDLCVEDESREAFHSFRKLAKQLWYAMRVTSKYWPNEGGGLIRDLGCLGELAGRERDFRMLADALRSVSKSKAATNLLSMIERESTDLRNSTMKKAFSFYELRPKSFIDALTI